MPELGFSFNRSSDETDIHEGLPVEFRLSEARISNMEVNLFTRNF